MLVGDLTTKTRRKTEKYATKTISVLFQHMEQSKIVKNLLKSSCFDSCTSLSDIISFLHVKIVSAGTKKDLKLLLNHLRLRSLLVLKLSILLLGQWLNFKLLGITYLVGKIIRSNFFFQGPLAE